MALFGSSIPPAFQVKLKEQPCQLCKCLLFPVRQRTSRLCSVKPIMAQLNEPNNFRMKLNIVRERFQEVVPDSVKEFPWRKAEDTVLQQLLYVGKKTLNWALIILFIISSLSDVIFSISRNKELLIPVGLFVGCLMTDFLKETAEEFFQNSPERGWKLHFLGISCFFVLVKFFSMYVAVPGRVFLLNSANGGLMQVLWLWKCLLEERESSNAEDPILGQDASMAMGADERTQKRPRKLW